MNENSTEIEPGFYWAVVDDRRVDGAGWPEVIEYCWINEYAAWDEEEPREYCWNRSGSDVPLYPDQFKLLPHSGPLKPPSADFEEIKAIDPHPVAVEMVEHIKPVRDNESGI